jgi:hypothetical protein
MINRLINGMTASWVEKRKESKLQTAESKNKRKVVSMQFDCSDCCTFDHDHFL